MKAIEEKMKRERERKYLLNHAPILIQSILYDDQVISIFCEEKCTHFSIYSPSSEENPTLESSSHDKIRDNKSVKWVGLFRS